MNKVEYVVYRTKQQKVEKKIFVQRGCLSLNNIFYIIDLPDLIQPNIYTQCKPLEVEPHILWYTRYLM